MHARVHVYALLNTKKKNKQALTNTPTHLNNMADLVYKGIECVTHHTSVAW